MPRLDVRIVEARNLPDQQLIGTPDPYVKVSLEHTVHKSKVIENSLNPKWDEVFKFNIADEQSSQLKIEVWNKNTMSDDFMGKYNLSMSGLTRGYVRDEWFLLQQCKSNAEIHVRLLAVDFGQMPTAEQQAELDRQSGGPSVGAPQGAPPQGQYPPPQQGGYPPQQGGYPPQGAPPPGQYPPPQGAPPPSPYPPPPQGGYPPQGPPPPGQYPPPQQGGYPPQQPGYPPQQGGYPPPQQGYPPQGPPPGQGYPPPQQGGYPPQQGGYPPQQGGYPPQQGPGYPAQQQQYAQGYPPQRY